MEEQATNNTEVQVNETEVTPTEATFTQSEVDKMLQAETDKRVNSALEKAKLKWETEYQEKLASERSEAEKLARMSESERQKAELEKMQKGFDDERARFDAERKAFEQERMKLQLTKELSAKDIPIEFADFLLGQDADVTKTNLDTFSAKWEELLQSKIEKHINERLQGAMPTKASGEGKLMSKREFANLPTAKRMQMLNENPELVHQILNQ